ncbi:MULTISPECIES: hypothetical protein [Dermacoccus]|uniref:hypothetical protein n=1 Tax=Dermacoccus TaxID=57495 RepID=UPI000ED70D56|nr:MULTISPECIES: hypothetical protein [Dermacoccus]MBO1758472.1 hypothetical protein [Dermacoccus sp. NHGro5]NHC31571.1 hypothetical protein [Dermacoccus nishinomiyaensis]TCJ92223.1 hypothetical protein EDC82_2007 [Dermacoccus sp. SAI-028]HCQ19734.1 hypothetical protein [Dermacoccus sp.]
MTIDLENTGLMRLERGAMQNWSDVARMGAPASAAVREVVANLVDAGDRVLVVGPTALDLVTELADLAGALTVLTRSIPDGATYAEALVDRPTAQVVCGDILNVEQKLGEYDVVLVLDDLARVPSLEDVTPTWTAVFEAVVACVAPGGRLALAVENELGLHRITSLRSRYTQNDDAAWDVLATFDASRPRHRDALDAALATTELREVSVADLLPTWDEHTLLAWNTMSIDDEGRTLLDALTLASPALRRIGADPTRVTRAAVLGGRLAQMPSGWFVVAGRPVAASGELEVLASTLDGGVIRFECAAGTIRQGDRQIAIAAQARPFAEEALDACASGDASRLRTLLARWVGWARGQAREGRLDAEVGDLRFDNLLVALARDDDHAFTTVAPAPASSRLDDALWAAVVDFVAVIRARGSLHLWPAATDDRTMAATIGAMAGLAAPDDLDALLAQRASMLDLPAHDVSGLLAVIERLEEKNKALASRANWFESRLNLRERELRSRAQRQSAELALARQQQEALRKSAEDLRRSMTYRLGNVAMGPLKQAKRRFLD